MEHFGVGQGWEGVWGRAHDVHFEVVELEWWELLLAASVLPLPDR